MIVHIVKIKADGQINFSQIKAIIRFNTFFCCNLLH